MATPVNQRARFLGSGDLAAGAVIAATMIAAFCSASHGLTLILTFVPGVGFALLLLVLLGRSDPERDLAPIGPLFWLALAIQLLHFGEEYLTGFPAKFPGAYGARPFGNDAFVAFNMCAYAVFTVCGVAVFHLRSKRLLLPGLFFVAYGTWGNAVSHFTWCALVGGYFPGGATAALHALVGPALIHRIIGRSRPAVLFLAAEAIVLVGAALVGFDPAFVRD